MKKLLLKQICAICEAYAICSSIVSHIYGDVTNAKQTFVIAKLICYFG